MLIYIVAITIAIVLLCLYTLAPSTNWWTRAPGKLSIDGWKVYLGDGEWDDASYTLDGKEFLNPLTKKLEPVPGVISDDKTTVFNGETWEPVTLSTDGKSYLNPVTNKYAPVELVRTDKYGHDEQWNLFTNQWVGFL